MTTKMDANGDIKNVANKTVNYREVRFHTDPNHYYIVYGILAGAVILVFIDLFFCTKKDYDKFTPYYLEKSKVKK